MSADTDCIKPVSNCPVCMGTGLTLSAYWRTHQRWVRICNARANTPCWLCPRLRADAEEIARLMDTISILKIGVAAGDDVEHVGWCDECKRYMDVRVGCLADIRHGSEEIARLKSDMQALNINRDFWKAGDEANLAEIDQFKGIVNRGVSRAHKDTTEIAKLNGAIDRLKDMVKTRDAEIERLQAEIKLLRTLTP